MGASKVIVTLPTAEELPAVLLDLAVPHEDVDDLVAMLPSPERTPEVWSRLEALARTLVRDLGSQGGTIALPDPPREWGALGRRFYVYVFLAALPHATAYHRSRGVPDDVSRRTLADLGRHMAVHRRDHGVGGLSNPFWLSLHFRGAIYDLGRLQFERVRLGQRTGHAVGADGLSHGPGDPALSVHIPDFAGPLTPAACDAAFDRAREFFPAHFPEEEYAVALCRSWLLDEQLADYLPDTSNIIRFQRRFRPVHRSDEPSDAGVVRFVFGLPSYDVDLLPRRTTLERAIVDHLRAGRHWHDTTGWLGL